MPDAVIRRRGVLPALALVNTLGIFASTIYVPSIPAIARGLETTVGRVQLTFVGYLFAFAIGMLAFGPVSDRYGRRPVLFCGLALSMLASLACMFSQTIGMLIAARIIQGLGASAGLVVGRATIRDVYGRDGAAQVIAGLAIAMTLLQAFAPIPGGYLQTWFGWRANFAAVTAFAVAALVLAARFIPETQAPHRPAARSTIATTRSMLSGYLELLATPRFLAYALIAAGAHAGFHIFAAGAPALLIGRFGIRPEEFGYYASLPPIGFLVGSFVSNRLTRRIGIDALIRMGSVVLVSAGLTMVALALFGVASPYAVVGPMIFVCCGSGLVTPNAVAGSLGVDRRAVGSASGLASFLQMAAAASATAALSLGSSRSPLILACVIAFAGLFGTVSFASLIHRPARRFETGSAVAD